MGILLPTNMAATAFMYRDFLTLAFVGISTLNLQSIFKTGLFTCVKIFDDVIANDVLKV